MNITVHIEYCMTHRYQILSRFKKEEDEEDPDYELDDIDDKDQISEMLGM